jgi:universal stress protein E
MSSQEKLFVVVDPTNDKHIALERALLTAEIRDPRPLVHVFVAVDPEAVDTRAVNADVFRDETWFKEHIRTPLVDAGLDYKLEVSWSSEWQKSIMQSAKRWGADAIFLSANDENKKDFRRFFFTDSKWELLKNADCPVVLIRPDAKKQRKVILAAVNFQAARDEQKALNKKILEEAKRFAEGYGAELHLANGYMDSLHYPDRGKLVNETGVIKERIHVEPGYTDEVVAAIAEKIDADLVVMGTLGQNGMLGISTRRGNTAERLIAALDDDVMVINQ